MIGQRIREERLRQNLSVKALALEIGLTPSGLSQIERGKRSLKIEVLLKIAEALHVTPNYILGMENGVTSDNTDYTIYLPKKDIKLLNEIRKYDNLYRILSSERMEENVALWARKQG